MFVEVSSINLLLNRHTQKSTGICFMKFPDENNFKKALAMNGKKFRNVALSIEQT